MKFVCDKCSAKYTISDSKVRGKILKIKCKGCGNIIEVRDPSVLGSDRGGDDRASKPPASADKPPASSVLEDRFAESFESGAAKPKKGTPGLYEAVKRSAETIGKDEVDLVRWFVAIEGKPIGPTSARTVFRHQKAGRVGDDNLVWKEGMPDWTPLRHCKELVGLLARLDLEQSLAPPSEGGEEAEPRLGLFAEKGGEPAESPLRGRGLGALDARLEAPESLEDEIPEAPPPSAGAGEPRDWFSDDFAAGMESSLSEIQSISPPRPAGADLMVKVAAVGFFVAAVGVLVAVFVGGGSGEVETITKTVEVVKEKVIEKEKIVYRDRPAASGEDEGEEESAGKVGRKVARAKGGSAEESAGKKPMSDEARKLLEQMGAAVPGGQEKIVGSKTSSKKTGGGGSGETSLSKSQLTNAVNKNRGSLQLCYERSMKVGEAPDDKAVKALVRFTVSPSGMVRRASVSGAGAQYPKLKSCLEKSVKNWVFPASSGESTVEYPFVFTPK